MELKIDEEKNIAYIKLSGQLTKEVILSAFDLTASDKRYKKGMGRLWDFRDADLSLLDTKTVADMAQYSLKFPLGINDVKVASVVSRNTEYRRSCVFQSTSDAKTPIDIFLR